MQSLRVIFSAGILLTATLFSSQASALASFGTSLNAAYLGKNLYTGSCTVCHNTTTNDPTWFSQYGSILLSQGADDDLNVSPMITSAGRLDFDNDGFTVNQEIHGGSFAAGSLVGTPSLAGATPYNNIVYAKPALGETINNLTVSTTTAAVTNAMPVGHVNRGGILDFTITTADPYATLELMFKAGAIQLTNRQVQFVADDGTSTTAITPVADTVDDGNITIRITDEGPYDLYTIPNIKAAAIARTPNFIPTAIFDGYASVSPYAQISPYATVISGATIDAYAIVDAYAFIDATATVGSYAYVDPYVYVGSIVDAYVRVSSDVYSQASLPNTIGVVKSRIAVTTTPPLTGIAFGNVGDGDGGEGSSGGLHCMTTGLGTTSLMFFGLFLAGFFIRRKQH